MAKAISISNMSDRLGQREAEDRMYAEFQHRRSSIVPIFLHSNEISSTPPSVKCWTSTSERSDRVHAVENTRSLSINKLLVYREINQE